jgi:hypothetical protein
MLSGCIWWWPSCQQSPRPAQGITVVRGRGVGVSSGLSSSSASSKIQSWGSTLRALSNPNTQTPYLPVNATVKLSCYPLNTSQWGLYPSMSFGGDNPYLNHSMGFLGRAVLGFEFSASHFLGRCFCQSFLCFIFQIGSHLFANGWLTSVTFLPVTPK